MPQELRRKAKLAIAAAGVLAVTALSVNWSSSVNWNRDSVNWNAGHAQASVNWNRDSVNWNGGHGSASVNWNLASVNWN
jgi:hypothetical protein